jgi:tetratricopeptide (TPR) repeat protein
MKAMSKAYLALLAAALGLRLLYLREQAHANPLFDYPVVDAAVYTAWAQEIVRGQWWWPAPRNYLPIYPWFLALCTWFSHGMNPWSVKLVQSLLASGACVMLAAATRRAFGSRAAVAAGALFAGNWLFVIYDAERYSESLCLTSLAAWLFLSLCRRATWYNAALAGGACAVACGCRPNLLALVPLGATWVCLAGHGRLLQRLARGGLFLAMAALLIGPVAWHNHRLTGRWQLRAQQMWNLYAALDPEIGGLHPAAGVAFDRYVSQPVAAAQLRGEEEDRYWLRRSIELLRAHPREVAFNYFCRRGMIFITNTEWSQEFDVYAFRAYSRVLSLPWPGFGWIFPLAGIGLLCLTRGPPRASNGDPATAETRRSQWFLAAALLLVALCTFAFKVTGRYRMPVTFLMLPFAGAGVGALLSFPSRPPRTRALLAGLCLALAALSWPDWPSVARRQTALHDLYIGKKSESAGRAADAEAAFRKAIVAQPGDPNARSELARLLLLQNRLAEAEAAADEAIRLAPESWRVWTLRACVEKSQQRFEAALSDLDRSLSILPFQSEPWMVKAEIFAATGRALDEADALRKALVQGGDPGLAIDCALRLDAGRHFQEALQLCQTIFRPSAARADRAQAGMLAGYLCALRMNDVNAAGAWWERVTAFRDVPFHAEQAAFLAGALPEAQYRSLATARKDPRAMDFFAFNRGLRLYLRGEHAAAQNAWQEGLTPEALKAATPPAAIPQRWAWEMLHAQPVPEGNTPR